MLGKNGFMLASLILIAVYALAEGGAFEPDQIIGVDTVTVVRVVPLRIDTVYADAIHNCGVLMMNEGREIRATHVTERRNWNFLPLEELDGRSRRWFAYRSCAGHIVQLDGRPWGTVFAVR